MQDSHKNQTGSPLSPAALIAYLFAASILMVTDHRTDLLSSVRHSLGLAAYPILESIDLPIQAARWTQSTFQQRESLQSENETLKERLLVTENQLSRLAALEAENERLRALLDTSEKLGQRVQIAELIAVGLDPYRHRVALNKGARHQVYEGQPVMVAGGLMGQIESVSVMHSYAMLISDPGHAVPVVVNRTGLRTIAYGTGDVDNLLLRDVSPSADVQVGDLLVTSGLGGRFPAGFPVATVTLVRRDPGDAFLQIDAKPTAALNRIREVLLAWPEQLENAPGAEINP